MAKNCIVMPLFNDWESATQLVEKINSVVADWDCEIDILIVNDGSQNVMPDTSRLKENCLNIHQILVLELYRNQGHQRAIATGLVYAQKQNCFDTIFVMDSDGEDRPEELRNLYDTGKKYTKKIITAERVSRSEGSFFRFCYVCYKLLFYFLTGTAVRFGNFCAIPANQLEKLIHYPQLWNNLTGGIIKSGLPRKAIPSHRGLRYRGPSKMNFIALILHGLSITSVYLDVILIRLITITLVLFFLGAICIFILLSFTLFEGVKAWLLVLIGGVCTNFLFFSFVLLLILLTQLNNRSNQMHIPANNSHTNIKALTVIK